MLTNVSDPEAHRKISVSELGTLLRCTKKHFYAYRQGLTLAEPPSYLSKGSYLHKLKERFYSAVLAGVEFDVDAQSKDVQAAVMAERGNTVLETDRLEVNAVFRGWLDEYGQHLKPGNIAVVNSAPAIELEFKVDLGWRDLDENPVLLHGFIDLVGVDGNGELWVTEHKTAGRAWSVSQLQFAYQGPLYVAAVEAAAPDVAIAGIQYNFFLPKRHEIKQVYTTPLQLQLLVEEVQQAIYLRDTGSIVRQPHWGCNDCWFKPLCYPELVGQDTTALRATMFKVDEDKAARFAAEGE